MGIDDSGGVTALVGLDGFVVCAQVHDGEQWWLAVETTVDVVGCEACGTRAVGHGRRVVKVRDLAIAGEPVTLVWAKRIWRCAEPDCVVKTWSEPSEEIAPRAVLSERARAEIARRVGPGEESVRRGGPGVRGDMAHRHGRGARSRQAPHRSPLEARCTHRDRAR